LYNRVQHFGVERLTLGEVMTDSRQPIGHPSYPQPVHPQHAQPPGPALQPNHAPQPVRPSIAPSMPGARPGIAPIPTMKPPSDADLEPISLVEELLPAAMPATATATPHLQHGPPPPKKIIAFGADAHRAQHQWKRQVTKTGTGACRVRSFHGKYSEQGLEYLDNAINEWLDNHPEGEVKFVTSTVMTFEGKVREPALVLNVWY
jgi:hypothetical protein